MKDEIIFNHGGYQFSIVGKTPTGSCMGNALNHINSLNTPTGTFKMQVIENGWKGTISTISFKKI